jgi:hypothetical protein
MALTKKGKYWYGTDANTSLDDIKTEMQRYSLQNG